MTIFDMSCSISHAVSGLWYTSLSCTDSEILSFYSERNCRWHWEVLEFPWQTLGRQSHTLTDCCVYIVSVLYLRCVAVRTVQQWSESSVLWLTLSLIEDNDDTPHTAYRLTVKPRLHDTTCCQTGCQMGWQPVVSCKRGIRTKATENVAICIG